MSDSTIAVNGRPLRVLLYAPWFAEYSTRLALALKEYCQVLLILDEGNSANECTLVLPPENASNITILKKPGNLAPARLVSWILGKAFKFGPHIVHVQELADPVTVHAIQFLRRWVPILLTVHDPMPHSGRDAEFLADRLWRFASLRRSATAYHVHGEYCRRALVEATGYEKPTVSTQHGVLFVPRADMIRDPEPGRVLLFGRMEAYKGIEQLLSAADVLHARDVNLHVVLAGSGPELARLSERMHESSGRLTVVNRYLSPAEVVEQFQLAELVVLPYRDATQSGVVAAAFGNGRPVVATAVGGLVDSVRDGTNGILVPPGDVEALANAMKQVIGETQLRTRLFAGARQSGSGDFSWNMVARTLAVEYVALLGRRDTATVRSRFRSDEG